ncbi:MAG: alpha/beta fold hydrolase [Vicinamibacterales bacterium]
MRCSRAAGLALLVVSAPALAQSPPASRDISLKAPDGTELKATYYAAAAPGPAVLLLHMCNTTRKSWEPLGPQLAAAGIHALAVDYRGFGESGGDRFDALAPPVAQRAVTEQWPGDVDAAYAFLLAQLGVDTSRIGAAGGSCGVVQAVGLARRHPNVRSLALLAGPLDPAGLMFLTGTPGLPLFAAAAADDRFDDSRPDVMQWLLAMSGNPRNTFSGFTDGGHGTEIFGPHPELPKQMVAWYADTLVKKPADPKAAVAVKDSPTRAFWRDAVSVDRVPDAVRRFDETRKKDPRATLFPEAQLNLLGYAHLQAGRAAQAIELFKLNTVAYPASANTYDSLGDAYLANGQNELALRAAERALTVLGNDRADEARKTAIRDSAGQKIAKLKGGR